MKVEVLSDFSSAHLPCGSDCVSWWLTFLFLLLLLHFPILTSLSAVLRNYFYRTAHLLFVFVDPLGLCCPSELLSSRLLSAMFSLHLLLSALCYVLLFANCAQADSGKFFAFLWSQGVAHFRGIQLMATYVFIMNGSQKTIMYSPRVFST